MCGVCGDDIETTTNLKVLHYYEIFSACLLKGSKYIQREDRSPELCGLYFYSAGIYGKRFVRIKLSLSLN